MATRPIARRSSKSTSQRRGSGWLLAIGVFKLAKGISLAILAFGLLRLLHKDVAAVVEHWVEVLRVDPDNRFIHRGLERIFNVTPKQLREFSAGSIIYSALFLTEGVGLLTRRHWAEYMTLITTGLFIPIEIYALWAHFTFAKLVVTVINFLIVWYLAARIRR
jgi:uncharacterized membrane protein (DUF2068 family)